MRDIRRDLKERLEAVEQLKQQLTARVNDLEQERSQIIALLQTEERRFNKLDQRSLGFNGEAPVPLCAKHSSLAEIVAEVLSDGRPHGTKELAEEAARRGYVFAPKSPNRSMHFAMLGLKSGGHVQHTPDGWKRSEPSGRPAE